MRIATSAPLSVNGNVTSWVGPAYIHMLSFVLVEGVLGSAWVGCMRSLPPIRG